MRRVLPLHEFSQWFAVFLPDVERFQPVVSPDPSDGKLAHLDGLNLSRAWMLRALGWRELAEAHARAGLAAVTGEHYEGGHWLGTFAVYLLTPRGGLRVHLSDYDTRWAQVFEHERDRIRSVLGERALEVEHAGSTSVSGLAAKPVIDIVLAVADSADESGYARDLEASGYSLAIREPHWHEHRLFKGPGADINLHVFSSECPEIDRMLHFRNWLRSNEADRGLYEATKRRLAEYVWADVQDYADAKAAIIAEILGRA